MPRAGLSPAAVVEVAEELVDEDGPQRLTLAAVARRCGVALPSLYKHVGGLDDLHARLAASVARELADVLRRAVGGRAGRDALAAMAHAYRDLARARPGRYHYLVLARPDDPAYSEAAGEALEAIAAVFRGYDLAESDVIDAARVLRAALHGFVTLEAAHGFGLPDDLDHSFERLVDSLDVALRAW